MEAMKVSYIHLLSDRDHLLNLAGIYLDALKKEEVDRLSHELEDTWNFLVCIQLALQDSERHVDELCLEVSSVRELARIAGTHFSFTVRSHVDDFSEMTEFTGESQDLSITNDSYSEVTPFYSVLGIEYRSLTNHHNHVSSQLRVGKRDISIACEHFNATRQLLEVY